jgi:hypothetical protein
MSDNFAFPFVIALTVSLMGVDTAVNVLPKADLAAFFEVHSIEFERAGDTAILHVDRTIHRPINMAFTVRIMSETPRGWVEVCRAASNVILYEPGRALPDPVTLDWWTWGQCPTLPEGPAQIVTTWDPEPMGLEAVTVKAEVD